MSTDCSTILKMRLGRSLQERKLGALDHFAFAACAANRSANGGFASMSTDRSIIGTECRRVIFGLLLRKREKTELRLLGFSGCSRTGGRHPLHSSGSF